MWRLRNELSTFSSRADSKKISRSLNSYGQSIARQWCPESFWTSSLRPENPLAIDPAIISEQRANWLEIFSNIMLR